MMNGLNQPKSVEGFCIKSGEKHLRPKGDSENYLLVKERPKHVLGWKLSHFVNPITQKQKSKHIDSTMSHDLNFSRSTIA